MNSEAIFSSSEGDAWFRRNPLEFSAFHRSFSESLRPFVGEGDALLEIGCSDGRFLEVLRRICPSTCSFTGIEPSKEAVCSGRDTFPLLRLEQGLAGSFDLGQKFDLVIFGFCLYVMSSSEVIQSLANAERHLKEGGYLSIIDFDPNYPHCRAYSHDERITTRKLDYATTLGSYGGFHLLEKRSFPLGTSDIRDGNSRIALSIFIRVADRELPFLD